MPGHKGQTFLGCEQYDLTEVSGADALYGADGIISESEKNAAELFGTGMTLYFTEGLSQCIRGMLYLVIQAWEKRYYGTGQRPVVVAARNVHSVFVYAAALLDFDVIWLWPENQTGSICSCLINADTLETILSDMKIPPAAVYVTSPDYLGNQQDIEVFAKICHRHKTVLAVDNAHGAYLQINKSAPESFRENAKQAMALFGSTSPSYLILSSLDLCNAYLADGYREKLLHVSKKIEVLKEVLRSAGWKTVGTEQLKLTVAMPETVSGTELADKMRENGIECEFADPDYVVLMFTPENQEKDFSRVEAFFQNRDLIVSNNTKTKKNIYDNYRNKRKLSIREAVFRSHRKVPIESAKGCICGSVTVSCPPAIPILVSGEVIEERDIELFRYYGMDTVDIVIV